MPGIVLFVNSHYLQDYCNIRVRQVQLLPICQILAFRELNLVLCYEKGK